MFHVLIDQHHLILEAVSPDHWSAMVSAGKHFVCGKTLGSVPAGHQLRDAIYIFASSDVKDAGKLVLEKIQEALNTLNIVAEIKSEIATVRDEHQALKSAKARLEALQADGLMKFTAKVDARSFLILCAIIACGNVAKASRALKLGDSTVRDVVRNWKTRGPAYAVMSDLVRWRKRVGAKYTVPFNDAVLYEKDAAAGNESVFSELLDAVLSMTEANWPDICAELESILKNQIGR